LIPKNYFLWTTQLLGSAETYNCNQVIKGSIAVPKIDVLDETDPDKRAITSTKEDEQQ
jgi:hypothetical protein